MRALQFSVVLLAIASGGMTFKQLISLTAGNQSSSSSTTNHGWQAKFQMGFPCIAQILRASHPKAVRQSCVSDSWDKCDADKCTNHNSSLEITDKQANNMMHRGEILVQQQWTERT